VSETHVGKVYLVGAGPGHPELITLKGHQLIRQADIIVYDRLIQEEVLGEARADAEKIYVGKRPGLHESRQERINQTMVEAAHRAQIVVRLKGGDPVLFGRGGEEAQYLAAHGVPFEVVPGVTAGLSVPMAAGIPVTHRDFSSSVALVTGHRRDDKDTQELDWAALARIETLVFFMSVGKLPDIASKLIANGCAPDTPAAIIQQAYWPGEHTVVGSLEELPRLSEAAGIQPPATIVIGQVVRARELLTTLHRELRRDRAEEVGFGLSAEALMKRLTAASRVSRDVELAIELELFDELASPMDASTLARRHGWDEEQLSEMLARLASLGLLVRDSGLYQSSEAASRFLSKGGEGLGSRLEEWLAQGRGYDPRARLRDG
jgi:uroporphyrin-III C-methyltransferase